MKKIVLPVLLVLIIGAAAWTWYRYAATHEDASDHLMLYGNVDIRQVSLAFNASDRIAEIHVEEGELVGKGPLLAVLDTTRLELAFSRSEAQVAAQADVVAKLEAGSRKEEIARARAEVEAARVLALDAQRTYKRLQAVAVDSLASQEQVDNARANAEAAEAALWAAQENLNLALEGPRKEDKAAAKSLLEALKAERDIARQHLTDASLYAPADGVIENRILEPGDMASPQYPVFTLALTDPVWVRTYVSETDLGKLFPGMRAQVMTDSFPDKQYDGWVGFISPSAEFTPKTVESPEIRTSLVYQVRVFVCNPRNELRLGMPATVRIPLDQPRTGAEKQPIPACGKEPSGE